MLAAAPKTGDRAAYVLDPATALHVYRAPHVKALQARALQFLATPSRDGPGLPAVLQVTTIR